MLSSEDNELLCRVGRGTPRGDLLRHYWMPCLPAAEPKRMLSRGLGSPCASINRFSSATSAALKALWITK